MVVYARCMCRCAPLAFAKESRQRIASEHPEIVSMRNKAAGTAAKRGNLGLGGSAAGKDGVEEGHRIRLDRLRTKVPFHRRHPCVYGCIGCLRNWVTLNSMNTATRSVICYSVTVFG